MHVCAHHLEIWQLSHHILEHTFFSPHPPHFYMTSMKQWHHQLKLMPPFFPLNVIISCPLGYKKWRSVLSRKTLLNTLIRLPNHIRPWRRLTVFTLIPPEILCSSGSRTDPPLFELPVKCACAPCIGHTISLLSSGLSSSHIFQGCHLVPWVGFSLKIVLPANCVKETWNQITLTF